ncbi:MAG TPA: cell division protein FtsL [Usitatibacter sp.]|nr:cell division protein FtsL [Usitatibacter sp.]
MNILLLALLVACAIGVVTSQHRARRLFTEIEAGQAMAQKLDEEHTQLQLEQSTWATNRRIESVASRSLGMRLPDSASTVVITLDPRAGKTR